MFFLFCVIVAIAIFSLYSRQARLTDKVEYLSAQVSLLSGALTRAGIQLADDGQAASAQAASPQAPPLQNQTLQAPATNAESGVAVPSYVVPSPPQRPASPPPPPPEGREQAGVRAPADPQIPQPQRARNAQPPRPPVRREPEMSLGDMITAKAPYIVSRLGIALLVIGLALAIGYSWEYFGAGFKIIAGLVGAVLLVAGGEVVLRRPGWGWYGQAIVGGGYALGMFVAYAAQNIASVKVMDSPVISAALLLLISSTAMTHAVHRRSEPLALLATLLALATISLSPTTTFTFFGMVAILFGLQFVVITQRWVASAIVAMLGTYLTFDMLLADQLVAAGHGMPLLFSYLAWFWTVWTGTAFGLFVTLRKVPPTIDSLLSRWVPAQELPKVLIGTSVANSLLFLLSALVIPGSNDVFWMVLMGLGAAHALAAAAAWKLDWKLNFDVQTVAALSLVAAGSAMKLSPEVLAVVWLIEVPVLIYAGLRSQIKTLRYFGALLAVVTVGQYLFEGLENKHVLFTALVDVPYNVFVGSFAIASLIVSSFVYKRFGAQEPGESASGQMVLSGAAVLLLFLLTVVQTPDAYLPLVLTIEGLIPMLLVRRDRNLFVAGLIFAVLGQAFLVGNYESVTPLTIGIVACMGLLPRLLHRFDLLRFKWENAPVAGIALLLVDLLALSVVIALLLITVLKGHGAWVPAILAAEMVAWTVAGIALRDPLIRASGNFAALAVGYSLFVLMPWTWGAVIPVVVGYWAMFALNHASLTGRFTHDPEFERVNKVLEINFEALRFPNAYWIVGTLVLTLAFFQLASWQLLAIVLAVEGLALMMCGFQLKEKQFFLAGLGIFALLVGKLVFYDLSGAETIWRILSFVVAGALMMAAAFINARFNKVMEQSRPATALPPNLDDDKQE